MTMGSVVVAKGEGMTGCGGVCACRAPLTAGATDGSRVILSSGTGHVLREAADHATASGHEVRPGSGTLTVVVGGAGAGGADDDAATAWLTRLAGTLSSIERDEVRVHVGELPTEGDSLLAALMQAPTLQMVVARAPGGIAAGLAADRFLSHYQPIVDIRRNEVVAFEALLRAERDGSLISAGELFAAAEDAGWLTQLDRIGRERAIEGAGEWLGDRDLFVNFNPTSIYRPEVCLRTMERAVRRAGLDRSHLVFEVVESHAVDDPTHLVGILDHYRAMGCRVALDDMGAGYSSLTLLARVRPDVVKIDKALVQAVPEHGATAVVRSLVTLSHDLGARVVAEGIETADQLARVADLGVDLVQGWYLGRPVERPEARHASAGPVPAQALPADDAHRMQPTEAGR